MAARSKPAPSPLPRSLDPWLIALAAATVLWSAVLTTLAFRLHTGMRTHRADLGQVGQAVWNSSRGRFLEQTDNGFLSTRLTDHVEPILALISPVLWVWRDARALLLLQVLAVAVGAWFVYDLALLRLGRVLAPVEWAQVWRRAPLLDGARPLAFALGIAWLLAPQMQSAVLTELHAAPFAAPLILWALWAVETRRWRQFVVAAHLVAAVKEETALLASLLGLWAVWQSLRAAGQQAVPDAARAYRETHRYARAARPGLWLGAAVALLGVGWFALATFVVVPRFAADVYGVAESGYFARYGALGDSPLDIVRSLLTRPGLVWSIVTEPARLRYLFGLAAPFALLGLLAPEILLLSLPVLAANVLSAYPAQYYGEFHYSAPIIPYFAAASAFGVGRVWHWIWRRTQAASPAFQHMPAASSSAMVAASALRNPAAALRPIATGFLVAWIVGWSLAAYIQFGRGPGGGRFDPTPVTDHHRLLPEFVAQIPADAAVTATAAVQPHLAMRRFVYQFPLGLETPPGSEAATWALLDVTTNTDMAPGDLRATVLDMLANGWSVLDGRDGFLLLRKGEGVTTIPAPFYTFSQPGEESVSAPVAHDWPRWRQTRLVAEWPASAEPTLDVLTPSGETHYSLGTATPPALLWRETGVESGILQAGEPLRAETLWLTLPRSVLAHTGNSASGTVLRRLRSGHLASLPVTALGERDYAQALASIVSGRLDLALVSAAVGHPLDVTIWTEKRPTWPGDTVDVWLQWRGDSWPGEPPRLELHHNEVAVERSDGAPRLFGMDQIGSLATERFANDWRVLTLPADLTAAGDWSLALVGADGATLARIALDVRPHLPDQACALLGGAACASQPH